MALSKLNADLVLFNTEITMTLAEGVTRLVRLAPVIVWSLSPRPCPLGANGPLPQAEL